MNFPNSMMTHCLTHIELQICKACFQDLMYCPFITFFSSELFPPEPLPIVYFFPGALLVLSFAFNLDFKVFCSDLSVCYVRSQVVTEELKIINA